MIDFALKPIKLGEIYEFLYRFRPKTILGWAKSTISKTQQLQLFEPELEKCIVDDIARLLAIYEVFFLQRV